MIPVLGMHRSGTSALAGALHKIGADLGPESSWIAPAADNPLGFFEFEPVVELNRAVLAAFGGTWSSPPPLPPGWVDDERIADVRERVRRLAAEIPDRLVVKDPRLSLVMPLWDEIQTPKPGVLCVRNPAAVARSLFHRNRFTIDAGLLLWFRYTSAALISRPDALLVEYERLLVEPEAELRRVADHIGLSATDASYEGAAGSIREEMAHNEGDDLPSSPIGDMCRALYELVRAGQGLDERFDVGLWARLVTELPWAGPSDREIALARGRNRHLESDLERLRSEQDALTQRCDRLESDLRHAAAMIDRLTIAESASLLHDLKDSAT